MTFEDYLAIKHLIHRYPQCADKGDFEGVGDTPQHVLRDIGL